VSASVSDTGSWPAESATVPAARRLVREHLSAHGRSDLRDDAELLVSELVGNVVLHVGGPVTVTVRTGPDEVMLEVTDSSPVAPQLRLFSRTASTGRGMRLVHSLSADHGVLPQADGKTVWVRLSIATARRADDDLAASFADVDWLAELEADEDVDGVTASSPWSAA
jgi:anti-sigma regulatory factor (Ser/Thr protein kinase)